MRTPVAILLFACFITPLVAQKSDLKPSTETEQGQTQSQNAAPATGTNTADAQAEEGEYKGPWKGLQYRLVGPFRGGRVVAASGVVGSADVYYFGAVAGGVWKTTDGGLNWKPVFDKTKDASPSIGAIAVSESDPNVIYVGTGEACIRGNIVGGNGVYKSIDAGATWKPVGLPDTHAIGRLIVNPKNPDIAFVAALGHPFADNEERGIFRTQDGGKTWQKVLYKDAKTGGIDVVFDPSNANILYAALWQARRTPWSLDSGGPQEVGFPAPTMAAPPGRNSKDTVCRKAFWAALVLLSLVQTPTACGRVLKPRRAGFIALTIAANPGAL